MKIPLVGFLFFCFGLGLWAGRDYYNAGSYNLGKALYFIAGISLVLGFGVAWKEYQSRRDPLGIDDE